jgi:hypothetical protein
MDGMGSGDGSVTVSWSAGTAASSAVIGAGVSLVSANHKETTPGSASYPAPLEAFSVALGLPCGLRRRRVRVPERTSDVLPCPASK